MINHHGLNFIFILLTLIILLPINSPFSIISDVNAKSNRARRESSSNKGNNGKGNDNGDDG